MADEPSKQRKIYCNNCKQDTNHTLKGEHGTKSYDHQSGFGEDTDFRLWICMGCETGVLEKDYGNSEMMDGEGDYYTEVSYFPERAQGERIAQPYSRLKPKLAALYEEAITCYNRRAFILCAAGLRALLEGICQDKKVGGRNLKSKIDNLRDHLPNKNIIKNLHHFRFMGNEAVHELAAPKRPELAVAISVIEDLLSLFYELDYKASQLRDLRLAGKPKRTRTKKAVDTARHWSADAVLALPEPVRAEAAPSDETS